MSDVDGLVELLAASTVWIENTSTKKTGTGFFVGPGEVMTCGHIVEAATDLELQMSWHGQTLTPIFRTEPSRDGVDAVLLTVRGSSDPSPPCVLLDANVRIDDVLHTFGYSRGKVSGVPQALRAVSQAGNGSLKVVNGQVSQGLSGAPVLNRQTGGVCGLITDTINQLGEFGGYALPMSILFDVFAGLAERNAAFHRHDATWVSVAYRDALVGPQIPRWAPNLVAAAWKHGVTLPGDPSPPRPVDMYRPWTLKSPEWAFVHTLRPDPHDKGLLFAGLGVGQGVYQTRDGGRTWDPMNFGLGSRNVREIAVSHFDRRLYAATDSGLWASYDRGATWSEDPDFNGQSLLSVALSPHDRDLIIVGPQRAGGASMGIHTAATVRSALLTSDGARGDGLTFSTDRGKKWRTFLSVANVNAIWVDPDRSRVFAMASAEEGIFFSRDGLENLRPVASLPDGHQALSVSMVPGAPERLVVGTLNGGLYWSDDDGAVWQRSVGIPDVQVSCIVILQNTPATLAVATPIGVFESSDRGNKWHQASDGLDYKSCIAMAPLTDGSVLLGTDGAGAYQRKAAQRTWNRSSHGFPPAVVFTIAESQRWLFAGTIGLLKSPDGGRSWTYAGLPTMQVVAVAVVPTESTVDRPAFSVDGGLMLGRSGHGSSQAIAVGDETHHEIVVGTYAGELYRSRDSGVTWSRLVLPNGSSHNEIRSITLCGSETPRIGVLVGHHAFYLSHDDGQTWSSADSDVLGTAINEVLTSRHDDLKLFALSVGRGILLSSDGGKTWNRAKGIPDNAVVGSLAEDPDDPLVVFAASVRSGMFRSSDGGCTFAKVGRLPSPARTGSDEPTWSSLVVCRSETSTMLVVGSQIGAFQSNNAGTTWEALAVGLHENEYSVYDLVMTADASTVLMATNVGLFSKALANRDRSGATKET